MASEICLVYSNVTMHLTFCSPALVDLRVPMCACGCAHVYVCRWFDKEHGLEHVLWPDRDGDGTADVGTLGDLVKYKVAVYTSDIR